MSETNEKFETWAVLELFGHRTLAGKVTEQAIGGCTFVRVDVPPIRVEGEGTVRDGFCKFLGQAAIYSITPCSEEIARAAAQHISQDPIPVYMPELQRALPRAAESLDDEIPENEQVW